MAWTNPTTVSTGTVLTASRYNADVVANWNMFGAAWTSFIPTLSGGWALGNSTYEAKYLQVGRMVSFYAAITVGSTATKGTQLLANLPVTSSTASIGQNINAYCTIPTVGTFPLPVIGNATSKVELMASVANQTYTILTGVTATIPGAWATNSIIYYGGTYEAASA